MLKSEKGKLQTKCLLACSPDTDKINFPHEFTENCFVFDQSSHIILLMWYRQLYFFLEISHGYPIGGEYNPISLCFCKLRQHVFFLFPRLDVRASENLSNSLVFNQIFCNKSFKGQNFIFFLMLFLFNPGGQYVLESERPLHS